MTRRIPRTAALSAALLIGPATSLLAQVVSAPRPPRFEISGGGLFVGGYSAGERSADITANQTGGPAYTLFKSKTRVDSAPGFEARLGFRVSRLLTIEGGAFMARPKLSTRLTADIEGAPEATVTEDLSVYIIDAAVLASFGAESSRVMPFVRAGAGYVRELHQDNALVETGWAIHAGGGVTFWMNPRQTVGVRADARVYFVSGGIDLDGGRRTQGAGGAAVVLAF